MHVGTEGNWTLVPGQSLCVFQDFSNFEEEDSKELVLNYIFNLLFENLYKYTMCSDQIHP